MGWKKYKLAECCISISDGDHQPPPKAETGIPFVTISNIDSTNHFDFDNVMYVPRAYYDSLDDKRKAKENDILYSVVGSFHHEENELPERRKDSKRRVLRAGESQRKNLIYQYRYKDVREKRQNGWWTSCSERGIKNDKNPIHLPRQYMPQHDGPERFYLFGGKSRAWRSVLH